MIQMSAYASNIIRQPPFMLARKFIFALLYLPYSRERLCPQQQQLALQFYSGVVCGLDGLQAG